MQNSSYKKVLIEITEIRKINIMIPVTKSWGK